MSAEAPRPWSRLVPRWLVGTLAEHSDTGELAVHGALLFADISGYSKLADSLARRFGDDGTDRLIAALNHTFAPLVDAVDGHGGEIVAFAGDAAVAWWPQSQAADRATCVGHAAACARTIQAAMATVGAVEGIRLEMRQVVAAGPLRAIRVGSDNHGHHIVLAGSILHALGGLLSAVPSGEVGLHASALLPDVVASRPQADGTHWLDGLVDSPALPASDLLPAWGVPASDAACATFVVPALRAWMRTTTPPAELRAVTSVFIDLRTARPPTRSWLAPTVGRVQGVLAARGGTVQAVLADDKGLICVAAFGLPSAVPLTAADPVLAGLELERVLQDHGEEVSVAMGLVAGRAFFGCVGGRERTALGLTGGTLNRAARLMGLGPGIHCGPEVRRAAQGRVQFDEAVDHELKGIAGPVAVSRARCLREPVAACVGRDSELNDAVAAAEQALAGGGGILLWLGPPGIGRTTHLRAVGERLSGLGRKTRWLQAQAGRRHQAFGVWRSVVRDALGSSTENGLWQAASALAGDHAPLLGPAVGCDWPDSTTTASLVGFERVGVATDLLVRLLSPQEAGVLLLDDAQWADDASLALAARLAGQGQVLLGTLRGSEADVPSGLGGAAQTTLPPLSPRQLSLLLAHHLQIDSVPASLVEWTASQSSGIPQLALVLVDALADRQIVQVTGSTAFFDAQGAEEQGTDPPTLEAVLASRLDELPAVRRDTLQVAAALGQEVDLAALLAGCTSQGIADPLPALAALEDAGWLHTSGGVTTFASRALQQAAHGRLTRDRRRALHTALAHHLESREEAVHPARLAWHLRQSDQTRPALDALDAAFSDAMRQGLLRSAERHARHALQVDQRARNREEDVVLDATGRARWHYRRAQSCRGSGGAETAHTELLAAARLLQLPAPTHPAAWRRRAVVALLRCFATWLLPARLLRPRDVPRNQLEAGVLSLSSLVTYLRNQPPEAMVALALAAVERAWRSPEPVPAAIAHSMAAVALAPLERVSARLLATSQASAQALGDPRERLDAALGAVMLALGRGDWATLDRLESTHLPLAQASGSDDLRGIFVGLFGCAAWCRGDHSATRAHADSMLAAADAQGAAGPRGWGLNLLACATLQDGDAAGALAMAAESAALLDRHKLLGGHTASAVQSCARVALGEVEAALSQARTLAQALADDPVVYLTALEAYAAPAHVALTAAEDHGAPLDTVLLADGLAQLARFARRNRIGQPRLALLRARHTALTGRPDHAREALEAATSIADALQMPREATEARARRRRSAAQ